jgi:hypothetical protein
MAGLLQAAGVNPEMISTGAADTQASADPAPVQPNSEIFEAASSGSLGKLTERLDANPGAISSRDMKGRTLLHVAAGKRRTAVIEFLLARNAEVDAKDADGETALFYASRDCDPAMTRMLLAGKAEANARNASGETPLFSAAEYGCTEVVQLLVAAGSDVNAKDKNGRTPLHLAAGGGEPAVVELLLAKGANAGARSNAGHTATWFAMHTKKLASVTIGQTTLSPGFVQGFAVVSGGKEDLSASGHKAIVGLLRRQEPAESGRAELLIGSLCSVSKDFTKMSCERKLNLTLGFGGGHPVLHAIDWMTPGEFDGHGKKGGEAKTGDKREFGTKTMILPGPHVLSVSYFADTRTALGHRMATSEPVDIPFDAVDGHVYEIEESVEPSGKWHPFVVDKTLKKFASPM